MKVLIIPDIHQIRVGIDYAREHIDEVDKVVFLGDIVDNWESEKWYDTTTYNPINVINALGQLKRVFPKKIHWLLGNHDLSYLASSRHDQQVSGHQWTHHEAISMALRNYIRDIEVAVKLDGWVFSHAGFTDTWFKTKKLYLPELTKSNLILECNRSLLNEVENGNQSELNFHHCSMSGSGNDPSEGPLWVRPDPLFLFPLYKKQVVGHTECGPLQVLAKNNDEIKTQIYLLDSKAHECFTILDTKTGEIILPEDKTLETKEFTWDEVKKMKKEYRDEERKRIAFYKRFFM